MLFDQLVTAAHQEVAKKGKSFLQLERETGISRNTIKKFMVRRLYISRDKMEDIFEALGKKLLVNYYVQDLAYHKSIEQTLLNSIYDDTSSLIQALEYKRDIGAISRVEEDSIKELYKVFDILQKIEQSYVKAEK